MGLDVGERRVGVAVSDQLQLIASPVQSIDLKRSGIEALSTLVGRFDPERIIVGLPTSLSGREGPQAQWVREFARELAKIINAPITFWDERLTTTMAEQTLIASRRRRRERRERVDAVAAALILQSYLESRRRR